MWVKATGYRGGLNSLGLLVPYRVGSGFCSWVSCYKHLLWNKFKICVLSQVIVIGLFFSKLSLCNLKKKYQTY